MYVLSTFSFFREKDGKKSKKRYNVVDAIARKRDRRKGESSHGTYEKDAQGNGHRRRED